VSFYGDKEGRSVRAETGPRTNPKEPEEQRKENPALKPGEEKVVQEGEQGFDIVVMRIINRNGQETRQRFFTRYKPEPRIIEFGPGPTPSPTPAEDAEGREPREPRERPETPEPTDSPDPNF
jgi:hypothetical protein